MFFIGEKVIVKILDIKSKGIVTDVFSEDGADTYTVKLKDGTLIDCGEGHLRVPRRGGCRPKKKPL